ncbi:MAG TPA: sulfite exporter TauE/SafE family protein [Candidatus Aquilonibacter sp.]|nr:sulfite exporter TauE/SafE family protein [Candidatus Aquilonibacter sp.]
MIALILGFAIGTLVSMIGGGGGGLFVVVLAMLYGLPEAVAAATSLVVVIPTTIFGSIGHFRSGHVDIAHGLPLLIAGPFGAVIGTIAIVHVGNLLAMRLLSVFLIVLGVQTALSLYRRTRVPRSAHAHRIRGAAWGFLGGLTSGAFGISGSPPVVTGLASLGLEPVRLVGTSIFALTSIAVAGAIAHATAGDVRWDLAFQLAIGSAAGAYMGARLLARLDGPRLRAILRPALIGLIAVAGVMQLIASFRT